MKTYKQLISEMKRPKWEVPKEPGTEPIPKDHVRLFHQTKSSTLSRIRKTGIESRQPVEGPKGIYADTKGFYGKPHEVPTAEFHVHKSQFDSPFVHRDKVEPEKIIATHKPWHASVRYIDNDPILKREVEQGQHDDLLTYKGSKEAKAVRFIKKRAQAKK
jgi:hypothetical protein